MKIQNSLIIVTAVLLMGFSSIQKADSVNHGPLFKAISENDFNTLLKSRKTYPWLQDYLVKLLKTDLDFANTIENSKEKLDLLEEILKKTSFVPTKIQILNQIASLQKSLNISDSKTVLAIQKLTQPLEDPKDCSGYLKKGRDFRDLRDFDQSLFHFLAAFDCHEIEDQKIKALKEITLTHKVKFRGTDFLKASHETYVFSKEAFKNQKISANEFNKIGIEHVRNEWTYNSAKAAEVHLDEMKTLLEGKYSLQTVYWIKARIFEEKKEVKKSQEYLALALKEKPIVDEDVIAIYWQKFWNHMELKQNQEAEDSLKASLEIGNPNEGQARTYYWLYLTLETKISKLQEKLKSASKKDLETNTFKNVSQQINDAKIDLEKYQTVLLNKYPISFYSALINKMSGLKYLKSDLEDLNSIAYKSLPKSLSFSFYKDLHLTSTLATQSFLRFYYSKHKKQISKDQRMLIKRMMARNGETTELFVEIESRPEICQLPSAPCMDLFPTPYFEAVTKAAKKYSVPKELIYSIIRQESIFNPLAKSWADARGLMQLLPSVAKEISKKADVDYKSPLDLYSVEKNIFFGSYLIKSLYLEMNKSLVLGLSGYNAEKSRAKVWYKTRFKKDWLKFIEEIPYQETRNYNKLVLRNFLIYSNNDDTILKPWFPEGILN